MMTNPNPIYFPLQIIVNILAVVAFVFSTYTFIRGILRERKNIQISILDASTVPFSENKQVFYFKIMLLNKSQLPISISAISFIQEKTEHLTNFHNAIYLKNKSDKGNFALHLIGLPISLSTFECKSGCIRVTVEKGTFKIPDNRTIKVMLQTSRGKIKTKCNVPEFKDLMDWPEVIDAKVVAEAKKEGAIII